MADDTCSIHCVHPDAVAEAMAAMPEARDMERLAGFFSVLGDLTRVRILQALSVAELCVCDLSEVLGMSASAVSHQLRLLRASRLVRSRRQGKMVFYSLDDDHVASLLAAGLEHVRESP